MVLWSKGLGRRELPFRLAEADVGADGERLVLTGMIVAPRVRWDYRAVLDGDDVVRFVRLLGDPRIVRHLAATLGWRLPLRLAHAAWRGFVGLLRGRGR